MREENISILRDTLNVFRNRYYVVNGKRKDCKLSYQEMFDCQVYLPHDIEEISQNSVIKHIHDIDKMNVSCTNIDSYSSARILESSRFDKASKSVLVLNLANAISPGGGVRRGAKAQEEDLCRKSSLLLSLEGEKAFPYYAYNRNLQTKMGSDAIIITPKVEIIRNEKNHYLEDSVVVSVMTCAAPCISNGIEGLSHQQYKDMLYKRITGMLKIAAYLDYEYLVLGAFGCGAFDNDAKLVSDLFCKALKRFDFNGLKAENFFRRIDFAVLDRTEEQYNYKQFSRNFNNFYQEDKNKAGENKYTFFWKIDEKNGEFSNWYQRKFVIDDFEYSCVEQYMMSQKAKLFHDSKRYTAILRASSPEKIKALGREVTPFDLKVWNKNKHRIVKTGNMAKYLQNPDLKQLLLKTGNSILAEASPYDKYWGIGLEAKDAQKLKPEEWPGENLLGKILMEIREEFRVGSIKSEVLKETNLNFDQKFISKIELLNTSCADLKVDAIVNAANAGLWAGGGICGVIFKKAGISDLINACSQYDTPLKDGSAVITPSFNLTNAKAIIHAVGPNFSITADAYKELFDAYYNSLVVLKENNFHSISFPLISSGIYSGSLKDPAGESTKQCCRAYKKFIKDYPDYEVDVKLCAFTYDEMKNAQKVFDLMM